MFASSTNLLKDVPCPVTRTKGGVCSLINCIFKHEIDRPPVAAPVAGETIQKSSEPEPKRLKLQAAKRPLIKPTKENSVKIADTKDVKPSGALPAGSKGEEEIKLSPRPVLPFNPATLQQRVQYLKLIHDALVITKSAKSPKQEAMDTEYQVASASTTVTYPVNIRKLLSTIKSGKYKAKEEIERDRKQEEEKKRDEALASLIVPLELLVKSHYVTDTVKPESPPSQFVTECERCGSSFDTSRNKSVCVFHLLRREYDPSKGKRSDIFPCCSQPLGESNGCQSRDFHVWKYHNPAFLTHIIPFTVLPLKSGPDIKFAVGIDCEMGYTTFGMELIRVTIVDWSTNETILDRCVYPYGDVLDLNTRFSGISTLQNGIEDSEGKTIHPTVTFKEARDLLLKYVNRNTIIIGHGLENDLNALRLIHHKVVDTAILYPSIKKSRTFSLKQLSFKYLGRIIQQGEHDSAEDSLAAIDIVKENIKREIKLK